MQPVVVRGFAELRDAGITRTGYELHGLLLWMRSRDIAKPSCSPDGLNSYQAATSATERPAQNRASLYSTAIPSNVPSSTREARNRLASYFCFLLLIRIFGQA